MRRITEVGLAIVILLLTATLCSAQVPPTFQTGDVFVAIGSTAQAPDGAVLWYRNGVLLATLDTGQANTETAGMAFDAAGNLYATVFEANNIVKFDNTGKLLGTFGVGIEGSNPYNAHPESILFDSAGNAYVGQADSGGGQTVGGGQVLKFDASGNLLASFSPTTGPRGTDWIDLAADQKTLYYCSESKVVRRFDVSANAQLPDLNSVPLPGFACFALRILPNGNVLVADGTQIVQLDPSGNTVQSYFPEDSASPAIFGLTLDPDGQSFWTADLLAGTVWKINIATGAIEMTINTGSNDVGGLLVFGEPTGSMQTVVLNFSPGTNTQTANFFANGNINDPASHAMSLNVGNVLKPFSVALTAHYVPSDLSGQPSGPNNGADGVCEVNSLRGPNNLDCRLADGGWGRPLPNGDVLVPHCVPLHNFMCVWYSVDTTAVLGTDFTGPVYEKMGWNTNPSLIPTPLLAAAAAVPPGTVNPEYAPGWNNTNERLYDRHGDDPNIAFQFDITDYFALTCDLSCAFPGDQSGGGHTKSFNDFVWAAPPNPQPGTADVVELLVPVPKISPFPYSSRLPILVTFELENATTEKSDPTALTKPHAVNIGTLAPDGSTIPVQFIPGFPTTFTYSPFFKTYSILLSPAPYKTDGTVYSLQISSDLFPQPVTVKFVVKKGF